MPPPSLSVSCRQKSPTSTSSCTVCVRNRVAQASFYSPMKLKGEKKSLILAPKLGDGASHLILHGIEARSLIDLTPLITASYYPPSNSATHTHTNSHNAAL